MFCFHGTIRRFGEEIQRGIDLEKSRYNTDFGRGFYLTNNIEQAKNWARTKQQDYKNTFSAEDIEPVVIYYVVNIHQLHKLDGKEFAQSNQEWGKFVLQNRLAGIDNHIVHSFDYVVGSLADGKIAPLLKRVDCGRMNIKEFVRRIQPFDQTHTQLSIHTSEALSKLQYTGVKEIEY